MFIIFILLLLEIAHTFSSTKSCDLLWHFIMTLQMINKKALDFNAKH
jgi:hypothetical protein